MKSSRLSLVLGKSRIENKNRKSETIQLRGKEAFREVVKCFANAEILGLLSQVLTCMLIGVYVCTYGFGCSRRLLMAEFLLFLRTSSICWRTAFLPFYCSAPCTSPSLLLTIFWLGCTAGYAVEYALQKGHSHRPMHHAHSIWSNSDCRRCKILKLDEKQNKQDNK